MPTPPTSTPWVPLWPLSTPVQQPTAVLSSAAHLPGPWPKTFPSVTLPFAGDLALSVSASMWGVVGTSQGFQVEWDGVALPNQAVHFFNEASTHKQLTAHNVIRAAAAGAHTIGIRMLASGGSDANDYATFSLTLSGGAILTPPGVVVPITIGTTLPGSPSDGQEAILVDSLTAPTYQWHFKYVAGLSTNKWMFIGGSPALVVVAADETGSLTSGYADLTTVGPQFTLPRAGDYEVDYRAVTYTGGNMMIGLKIGAAAVAIGDRYGTRLDPWSTDTNTAMGLHGISRVAGAAASTVLKMQYFGQGNGRFFQRELRVTPVRVS